MILGLKRSMAELAEHDPQWGIEAAKTIERLWHIFGSAAIDIQHVGSTAIINIKAKPVIDIAVAVLNFDDVLALTPMLDESGFICVGWESNGEIHPMYQCGEFVSGEKLPQILTHFIHIVIADSQQWHDYINHRDFMNFCPSAASEYESLKIKLVEEHSKNYKNYFTGKQDYIKKIVQNARIWNDFGRVYKRVEPITKGLSNDKKYCVENANGERLILRVSDISEYDRKRAAYVRMQQMDAVGIPMSRPVDFGICNDGKNVFQLLTWCDGDDLETLFPYMTEAEQYDIGLKAGKILHKIHSVPVLKTDVFTESWNERYSLFIDESISDFRRSGVQVVSADDILKYFNSNRHLLKNRPQCYLHDDFHVGNLMLSQSKELTVIDWEIHLFNSYGDPWKELSMQETPHFSTGMIRGYFGGEPPEEYWNILALYSSIGAVSSVTWAYYHHPEFLESKISACSEVVSQYDNMQNIIPTWYLKDICIQQIDGVSYQLESPFDFSFMSKYGKVFTAFDEQGSGNIAFGVEKDGKKYFVKFAGAPKKNYIANRESGEIDTVSAVKMLKAAVPLYTELAHPSLIKFVSAEEIGGGYAAVFEWEDAIGIEPKDSLYYMRFMQMPIEKKIRAFEDIVEFHVHVAAKGYVALDFYDGSILYDYDNEKVIICDIDLYQKSPFINADGLGLVGSARYVSPEECVQDAIMDEITNVYTMGATAFALFAFGDRSPEAWTLNKVLYDVAKQAVSDERDKRQQSINEFIAEWRAAKG